MFGNVNRFFDAGAGKKVSGGSFEQVNILVHCHAD